MPIMVKKREERDRVLEQFAKLPDLERVEFPDPKDSKKRCKHKGDADANI